jgi:hypothetical protein
MEASLKWLVGQTLHSCEKRDYTWSFVFPENSSIYTQSFWRLVTQKGVRVTSEDHGHPFGLGYPVDAAQRVMEETANRKVISYEIKRLTSDLIIDFGDDVYLEFFDTSCGYESWGSHHESVQIFCQGGGNLVVVPLQNVT